MVQEGLAAAPVCGTRSAFESSRTLGVLLVAGVAVRLVVAFATHGLPYDVHSVELVRSALARAPLHVYSIVNPAGTFHWPYPPGFLPLVALVGGLADLFGGFSHLIRLPAIAADSLLTWLVWRGLEGRLSDPMRLLAGASVALGPVFIAISGYSAQIDSVAILPAVLALLVWEREPRWRAVGAGLLIGVGASVKTVPLAMVLALASSARSWREVATLAGCAVAVLLATLIPFLVRDAAGVQQLRHYAGAPGMGGLSLVLQPDLAQIWLTRIVGLSPVVKWLFIDHAQLLNGMVLAVFATYAARFRPPPRLAASLLWLMILAFGSGFFFQYLVWGLPFFLLAGYVRTALLLQIVVTAPMLIFYVPGRHTTAMLYVYVAIMLTVWLGWVTAATAIVRRAAIR